MELTLRTGVRDLPGIGEARAARLEKLGLATAEDLLRYFPRDYEDRRSSCTIDTAPVGIPSCVTAMVAEAPRHSYIRKGLELTKVRVVDAHGSMELTFFNQSYVKNALVPGETYVFYGAAEGLGPRRQMTNPIFESEGRVRFTGRIMPVYPLTAGISNNLLAGLTLRCAEACAHEMPEILPPAVRQAYSLASAPFSYQNIHFPTSEEALDLARRRLIFEELFSLSCGSLSCRERRETGRGPVFSPDALPDFYALLPFSLTAAQRRAIREAEEDCRSGQPMNRLVQGDVGSGKTMVAAACCFLAWSSGGSLALMAPTEILAGQHYRTLSSILASTGMRVGLLTGSIAGGGEAGGPRRAPRRGDRSSGGHPRPSLRRGGFLPPGPCGHRRTAPLWRGPARRSDRQGDRTGLRRSGGPSPHPPRAGHVGHPHSPHAGPYHLRRP